MHQEKVDIFKIQVVERILKGLGDVIGVVLVIPELGRDEKLITGHTTFLDGFSYSLFGSVAIDCQHWIPFAKLSTMNSHSGSVNVTISSSNGFSHGIFLCLGILPGAKANGRDFRASVELERSHFVMKRCSCVLGWFD